MSNSSWPPELKAWVQNCLSRATPSNKTAVNLELKEVLFRAHKDNSINTTDWSKVELNALKTQQIRMTHTPVYHPPPPPAVIPPPSLTIHYTPPTYVAPPAPPKQHEQPALTKKAKKAKQKKNSISDFPTPYHFTGTDDSDALARRAARFAAPASSSSGPSAQPAGVNGWFGNGDDDFAHGIEGSVPGQVGRKRMKGAGGFGFSAMEAMEVDPNVIDWDRYTIKGTNQKLEKKYLRLTSEPSPADIRPLPVLKQTLQLLKRKWKENHNYAYAVDQFKSMRQDLTVQRIKNEFTVEVYEIHARIALEAKDLGEYNQCQTMLRQLYELGISGHPQEFLSYRIIYLLHTRNRSDMASLLAQLTPAEKADPGVHHALQVAAAVATSNYARFFRLFSTAPNMSGYIMDHFVERERMAALATMSKAYLSLALSYITTLLAFDSDPDTDKFLSDHKIAIYVNSAGPTPLATSIWDCKKAQAGIKDGMQRYRVVDLKGQVD